MLVLEELLRALAPYRARLVEMGDSLDSANARIEIDRLEALTADADFWADPSKSQGVLRDLKMLRGKITAFDKLNILYDDVLTLAELGIEAQDASVVNEAEGLAAEFTAAYDRLRVDTLLAGEYDANNAIVTLHPGAGGTESCDWVAMLLRMYGKWAEKRGFTFELLDLLDGEEAGVKSATFQINGDNAFGYLKSERGIHRLVRISPFDSSGRRHTSFASCDVMPELDDSAVIEIKPEELRVDTYRSGGAGGQHVNTTDSAIRITHIPTGIVVQCQNERSQIQNRERAMKMLSAKLFLKQREEQMEKLSGIRGEQKDNSWGSQIRNYVFHPYSLVKDLRTGEETGNVQAVMDGALDPFMNAYLIWSHKSAIQAPEQQ
ncbi:MAG: peptide chain release factor 2 [Defluviitaleaceae bacterium]|nr:peptide chain release factor 2 [Defluviitaleaceae bacterium]MCL2275061.1 peptide chain release factor 2 [Defluviitaleaceae bacterium]